MHIVHVELPGELVWRGGHAVQKRISRAGNLGIAPERLAPRRHSNYQLDRTWVSPSLRDSNDLRQGSVGSGGRITCRKEARYVRAHTPFGQGLHSVCPSLS
eukprot:6201458-Prymnesium_polylepis.2